MVKNLGLLLVAPFIGLAFIVFLPALGFYGLAKLTAIKAHQMLSRYHAVSRSVKRAL